MRKDNDLLSYILIDDEVKKKKVRKARLEYMLIGAFSVALTTGIAILIFK